VHKNEHVGGVISSKGNGSAKADPIMAAMPANPMTNGKDARA
jgi:hypothetical protein